MKRFGDIGIMRVLSSKNGADLLLWVVIAAPVFLADVPSVSGDDPPGIWHPAGLPLVWAKLAAVLLLGLAVAVGRRHPAVAVAVPVALGLAANPELFTATFVIAQLLLAFRLGRWTPGKGTGLLFFGGVCLAGLGLAGIVPGVTLSDWVHLTVNALMTIMLPWLAGRYARQHDELVRTGWELAERLEREQDLIGDRMRLLERSRIAGDMHDSLGHELSLFALGAAALQMNPGLDESARKDARELRESAARATERLREIIGVLRPDGETAPVLPSGDTVTALVERAAASGMAVTLHGELEPLPPMADRAAYRVVQEALTNATKHAPGAAITVRMGTDPAVGEAVVTVANAASPGGSHPWVGTGGYGLIGLDERVRLAGGWLRARPVDGGFEVTARLPLAAGAAATPPDSRREFTLARRKVRRSMIDAIWMPAATTAALLLLIFGLNIDTSSRPALDSKVYEKLRIGQSQSSIRSRLQTARANDVERPGGAPPDPPGTNECRFYRTTAHSPSPVYRLCFTNRRLSHKDEVRIARP